MTLVQEKVKQAAGLLREFGIDTWITFTRESAICGDPTLVFLAPGAVTWHSAFIVAADGRTRAIVGLYDQKAVEETGAYDQVVGYVTGIKEPLLECLKEFILAEVDRRGLATAWPRATCPSVFTGPDTAQAHYGPTGRTVQPGHVLNMDFGVQIGGYCSDMQRTFYVRAPGETAAPEDVLKGFRTIVRAVEESRRAMRPGVEGRAVDAVARAIVVEAGYGEFPHALGHQVGRFAHDGTALLGPAWEKYAGKPFRKLEESMVFTLEPRLTVPGRGVVTIEDMVVVTAEGAAWLGRPQTELVLAG